MACLTKKGDQFHVRFRLHQRAYRRTLKTSNDSDAEAALHLVEHTLYRLRVGLLQVPPGVDVGDFIVSGGTLQVASTLRKATTRELTTRYLAAEAERISETFLATKKIHIKHLLRHLDKRADQPASAVDEDQLRGYQQARSKQVEKATVNKETVTLKHLYGWAVDEDYLERSPAARLLLYKCHTDQDPFRTTAEIEQILSRGGLTDDEQLRLWDCLYLTPQEIASILAIVRSKTKAEASLLLHMIPAYTGMRRGELLRLRWSDVDFQGEVLIARSRKQSRSKREVQRRIELHPDLKAELLRWRRRRAKGQYVLGDPKSLEPLAIDLANRHFWRPLRGTDWCLDRIKNRYKIGFHSYRHSFASNLAAAGVDQRLIDAFMGHQTEEMRRRYQHLLPSNRKSAILALHIRPKTEVLDNSKVGCIESMKKEQQ